MPRQGREGASDPHRQRLGLDGVDGALYTSRFRSPPRPQQGANIPADVKSFGVASAVCCIVQSIAWVVLSLAAILVYHDIIPSPSQPVDRDKTDYITLLTTVYFKGNSTRPNMPPGGLMTPQIMYYFTTVTFIVNAIWLIASSIMCRQVRLGQSKSSWTWVLVWAVWTAVVTVLDASLAGSMVGDMVDTLNWSGQGVPAYRSTLLLCSGTVLIISLRAGLLLLANITFAIILVTRFAKFRHGNSTHSNSTSSSPSATKREGPIDAYLYRDGDRRYFGMHNPVFIPDEDEGQKVASFKPDAERREPPSPSVVNRQSASREVSKRISEPHYRQGQDGRGIRDRTAHKAMQEDPEDVSHLSWMEEVDKHVDVDVRVRSMARPSAPPQYRFGFVEGMQLEDAGRQPHQYYRGKRGGRGGPHHLLPRVRINPNAPRFPVIPPPDYSPPPPARRDARRPAWGPGPRLA